MKILFLIISILCTTSVLTAQDLTDIYADEIPGNFLQNSANKKAIEINIKVNAQIHPDLIFYYLKSLKNRLDPQKPTPEMNSAGDFRNYRSWFLSQRSLWAEFQMSNIEAQSFKRLHKNSLLKFFEPYEVSSSQTGIIPYAPADTNLISYISYKYFTGRKNNYDSTVNYSQLNKTFLKNTLTSLQEEYRKFETSTDEEKEHNIERDLEFWYLCGSKACNNLNLKTDYEPFEKTLKYRENSFRTRSGFFAGLGLKYSLANSFVKKDFRYDQKPWPQYPDPFGYDVSFKCSNFPLASINLGYQIGLSQELAPLAYIQISAAYSYLFVPTDKKREEFFQYIYNIKSASEIQKYHLYWNGIVNQQAHMVSLQVVTPVTYLSKDIYFEFGADISYRFIKFDYEASKISYTHSGNSMTLDFEEKIRYPYKDTKFNISPVLNTVCELGKNYQLSINASILYETLALGATLNYFL